MAVYDKHGNLLNNIYSANGEILSTGYDKDGNIIHQSGDFIIRVLEYNVGNFSHDPNYGSSDGISGYTGLNVSDYIAEWENFINSCHADIALITESRKYIDSSNSVLAESELYADVFNYQTSNYIAGTPWGKVLLTKAQQSNSVSKQFTRQRSSGNGYAGALITINDVDIYVVSVHFIHDESNSDIRTLQMQELLSDVSNYENVIIGGDLNTTNLSELSIMDGFTFANGTLATYNTWEYPNATYPLDNVGVKGNKLSLRSFTRLNSALSDHYPTLTEILVG